MLTARSQACGDRCDQRRRMSRSQRSKRLGWTPASWPRSLSPSLFSSHRAAVITELENLAPDSMPSLVNLAAAQLPDLAVIVVHRGVPKGKRFSEKLKSAGVEVIECAAVKPWELPQFVSAEAKRAGSSIDTGAAAALVDAVGHDLRALAAAVAQLVSDGEGGPITVDQVRRYFGGRSEVTSFAVADAALAGRPALRWSSSAGHLRRAWLRC